MKAWQKQKVAELREELAEVHKAIDAAEQQHRDSKAWSAKWHDAIEEVKRLEWDANKIAAAIGDIINGPGHGPVFE